MSRARREAARQRAVRRRVFVWAGVGALVVIAAVIAIVAGSSGGSSSRAGISEVRPVQASGTLPPVDASGADPAIGMALPTVRGQSFDGKPVAVAPDGRPKVVVVGAHWCPHCQRELPLLANYLHANPPGDVDVVTVTTDTNKSRPNYPPSEWLDGIRWTAPVLADDSQGTAARALGVTSFPYFIAVNARGQVVARTSGEIGTQAFAGLLAKARGQ